jgi:hypothetical protein
MRAAVSQVRRQTTWRFFVAAENVQIPESCPRTQRIDNVLPSTDQDRAMLGVFFAVVKRSGALVPSIDCV